MPLLWLMASDYALACHHPSLKQSVYLGSVVSETYSVSPVPVCLVTNTTTYSLSLCIYPTRPIIHFLFTRTPQWPLFLTLVHEWREDGVSYKRLEIHIYAGRRRDTGHGVIVSSALHWRDPDLLNYWNQTWYSAAVMTVLQRKIYKTSTWWWWWCVHSGASTWSQQQGLQCCLRTVASAAGLLMISFWSSVIFSQQTAAYCLLLGGIKLCVLVGRCGGGGQFVWYGPLTAFP